MDQCDIHFFEKAIENNGQKLKDLLDARSRQWLTWSGKAYISMIASLISWIVSLSRSLVITQCRTINDHYRRCAPYITRGSMLKWWKGTVLYTGKFVLAFHNKVFLWFRHDFGEFQFQVNNLGLSVPKIFDGKNFTETRCDCFWGIIWDASIELALGSRNHLFGCNWGYGGQNRMKKGSFHRAYIID